MQKAKLSRGIPVLLTAQFIIALFLAGCSGNGGSGDGAGQSIRTNEKTQVAEQKVITFWHSFTQPERQDAINAMIRDFEDMHPDVKINVEVFPWATFHTKWTTGLATKALPDVSTALPDEALLMAKSNAISSLDDVVAEIGKDDFYQKTLDMLTYQDQLISVPYYAHARVLWYRKDLVEEKGLALPKTWDELLDVATKVQSPPDIYGMPIPMSKKDYFGTLYLYIVSKNMGAHILTEEEKVDLTSPIMIEAIKYLTEFYKQASPPGSVNYATKEHDDSFIQGNTAFHFNTGFIISQIQAGAPDLLDKIGAMPPMNGDKEAEYMSDYIGLVRWNHTEHPDLVKQFIAFMYEPENYINFLHVVPGGMLPVLKSVSESSEYNAHPLIQKFSKDVELIQKGVERGSPIGFDFGPTPAAAILKNQGIVEEMLTRIVIGNEQVEAAAKAAEDQLNKAIADLQ